MSIKIYNKDGFVSGGYIFDRLDRFSQFLVSRKSNYKYNFTSWGFIKYPKQLCKPDFIYGINFIKKLNKRKYLTMVYARDRNGVKVAWGIFCFVGTEKNFCEIKGK